jgi:hypothetical protein
MVACQAGKLPAGGLAAVRFDLFPRGAGVWFISMKISMALEMSVP